MNNDLKPVVQEVNEQIEINKIDGRTQIVFKKALLKGKVSSSEVLNTILIAARMQAEEYIKKLAKGSMLDKDEVKSLKDLADITKLEVQEPVDRRQLPTENVDKLKSTLYLALTEKLKSE